MTKQENAANVIGAIERDYLKNEIAILQEQLTEEREQIAAANRIIAEQNRTIAKMHARGQS